MPGKHLLPKELQLGQTQLCQQHTVAPVPSTPQPNPAPAPQPPTVLFQQSNSSTFPKSNNDHVLSLAHRGVLRVRHQRTLIQQNTLTVNTTLLSSLPTTPAHLSHDFRCTTYISQVKQRILLTKTEIWLGCLCSYNRSE